MSSVTPATDDRSSVPETVRIPHGRDGRSPSLAVVEAIAGLAGVDADGLAGEGVTLYDHVDPDALDTLVAGRGEADVSLTVAGYDVRVGPEAAVARRSGD